MKKKQPALSVIIAAAGQSKRIGPAASPGANRPLSRIKKATRATAQASPVRKPFILLRRKPILYYSLETFASLEETVEIIVAVNGEDFQAAIEKLRPRARKYKISAIVEGGKRRFDSVALALSAVSPAAGFVAVHDAARPFASPDLIRAVLNAAKKAGAAVPALKMSDTIKTASGKGLVDVTLHRSSLRATQTPQIFRRDWLIDAYARIAGGHLRPTDDAQVLEAAGYPVALVPGNRLNIKITHPEDLLFAKAILEKVGK
ncbi:MAG: 2-C-methyl-D-erythritol 4-phosphate cytidylyltransferase [Planctomycetota bacterium]